MKVLVSGGTGFIGSHTCVELLENGYDVVIFDNLYNSSEENVENIVKITGKRVKFYKADLRNKDEMEEIFKNEKIDALIHFAGLKAVGESVAKPLLYFENNITGSLNLFDLCNKYGVKKIVFSSSATVYGNAEKMPLKEDYPLSTTNPYGRTKLMLEGILTDLAYADKEMSVVLLRYFNPVGAHESCLIGENPRGIPNNLMPRIIQSAVGKLGTFTIFGGDYPTRDGTGVRDYIHVCDLAKGHICALKYAESGFKGVDAINLGRGDGVSVLELVKTFEKVNNIKLDYKISDRRAGDVAESYADVSKAEKLLGFKAEKTIEDMCRDSWNYYNKKNS